MSRPHAAEMSREDYRGKAFLSGLYLGLSLLLLISHLDRDLDSPLHKATNIYGLQALAGAALGCWRIRKGAKDFKTPPALAAVFICLGLACWVIGQGVWVLYSDAVPYARLSDVFFIAGDVSWFAALLTVFKSLGRRGLIESSKFIAIATTALTLIISGYIWINHKASQFTPSTLPGLVCDFSYILLTFSSVILAFALLLGDNVEIPSPVHQCIRYLFAATAINAVANLAFIVTVKIREAAIERGVDPATEPLAYFNGNWVDWLFLTTMYCWGVSALKWPLRQEELQYTSGTKRSEMREEDIYRSVDIAKNCSGDAREAERTTAYTDSIRWILDNIPGCWRVVKLGDVVIGSTFLFPVPQRLIESFRDDKTTEREMFEEVMKNPLEWDCLYLADASILPSHRRRRLALNYFKKTIENIAKEHPHIKVYCWPNTLERKKLAAKIQAHFKDQNINVILKE